MCEPPLAAAPHDPAAIEPRHEMLAPTLGRYWETNEVVVEKQGDLPEDISDRVDRALAAFWAGDPMLLDELLETADGPGPKIGSLLKSTILVLRRPMPGEDSTS